MAGQHQGEELVAQFFVGQRLAVLGPRLEEEREDVAALLEVGGAAALGDHRVDRPVEHRRPSFSGPIGLLAADVQEFGELGAGPVEAATRSA